MAAEVSGLGAFCFLDSMSGRATADFARRVETLGYRVLWFPEAAGREPFSHAPVLLGATSRLVVATGIANVFKREAVTTAAAAKTLGELFEGRFILGLGVSSRMGNERRGVPWRSPVTTMREYLERMRALDYSAPAPREDPPVVIAALLPKMLAVAAAETHGTLTYFVPPEHTASCRTTMRASGWVCVEQAVLLEPDPERARHAARRYMEFYLSLPTYRRVLGPLGFGDADFADGGSDRLVDAVVAWGPEARIRERIDAHFRAGATHVCILPLSPDGGNGPDERTLEALAPARSLS